MTLEAIEGNVEVPADNVVPEVEATSPEPEAEAADPEIAEAERLLEAEAVVEPQPSARSLDDLTEEELANHPVVNGLRRRWEMSAAQKEAERVKKQSGNDAAVREYAMRLKDLAESGDTEQYQTAVSAALALNRAYQEDQVVEFFSNGVKELYKVPPDFHEKAVQALERNDRAGYITNLIDGAVESRLETERAKIESELKEKYVRALAAERKADKIQSQPKIDAPPAPPQGAPAGTLGVQINTMSDADREFASGALPYADYKQYREKFGVGLAPGGGR